MTTEVAIPNFPAGSNPGGQYDSLDYPNGIYTGGSASLVVYVYCVSILSCQIDASSSSYANNNVLFCHADNATRTDTYSMIYCQNCKHGNNYCFDTHMCLIDSTGSSDTVNEIAGTLTVGETNIKGTQIYIPAKREIKATGSTNCVNKLNSTTATANIDCSGSTNCSTVFTSYSRTSTSVSF